jgi:hypothetical protein
MVGKRCAVHQEFAPGTPARWPASVLRRPFDMIERQRLDRAFARTPGLLRRPLTKRAFAIVRSHAAVRGRRVG